MQTKYDQHRNPMEAAIGEMRWCVETIDASLTAAAHSAVHMDARVALIYSGSDPREWDKAMASYLLVQSTRFRKLTLDYVARDFARAAAIMIDSRVRARDSLESSADNGPTRS